MNLPNLEKLEERILNLIHRYGALKDDYHELERMVSGLQKEIDEEKGINSHLQADLEDSLRNTRDSGKEERIKAKVEELLAQLEGI